MKKILIILLTLTVFLAACTPQEVPTMAPADVQNTAVSAVWTMAIATQLASSTATSLPPTETPNPTPTSAPVIPTLEQSVSPTATTVSSDPNTCNKALNVGEAGTTKNIRIENENKSEVNLTLNLYTPNEFGQCGFLSYVIKSGEKRKVVIPSGSWSAFAWVLNPASQAGPREFFIGSSGSQDLLRLVVKANIIAWVGP